MSTNIIQLGDIFYVKEVGYRLKCEICNAETEACKIYTHLPRNYNSYKEDMRDTVICNDCAKKYVCL